MVVFHSHPPAAPALATAAGEGEGEREFHSVSVRGWRERGGRMDSVWENSKIKFCIANEGMWRRMNGGEAGWRVREMDSYSHTMISTNLLQLNAQLFICRVGGRVGGDGPAYVGRTKIPALAPKRRKLRVNCRGGIFRESDRTQSPISAALLL